MNCNRICGPQHRHSRCWGALARLQEATGRHIWDWGCQRLSPNCDWLKLLGDERWRRDWFLAPRLSAWPLTGTCLFTLSGYSENVKYIENALHHKLHYNWCVDICMSEYFVICELYSIHIGPAYSNKMNSTNNTQGMSKFSTTSASGLKSWCCKE